MCAKRTVRVAANLLDASGDIEALITLFESVATEERWQPGDQLRAHRSRSQYLGVRVGTELAGGLQVVMPDADGHLPCQQVWPEMEIEAAFPTAHVAVLAVRKEFRGQVRLFWPLCVALWRFCIGKGLKAVTLEATPPMLARYRRLGWPLEQVGEERVHWGEPCLLCRLDVEATAGAMMVRAVHSPSFRTLVGAAVLPLAVEDCREAPAVLS